MNSAHAIFTENTVSVTRRRRATRITSYRHRPTKGASATEPESMAGFPEHQYSDQSVQAGAASPELRPVRARARPTLRHSAELLELRNANQSDIWNLSQRPADEPTGCTGSYTGGNGIHSRQRQADCGGKRRRDPDRGWRSGNQRWLELVRPDSGPRPRFLSPAAAARTRTCMASILAGQDMNATDQAQTDDTFRRKHQLSL